MTDMSVSNTMRACRQVDEDMVGIMVGILSYVGAFGAYAAAVRPINK